MVVEVILTSLLLISALEPDEVLKERFLKECPAALERLEARFSQVHGVARSTPLNGKSKGIRGGPIEFATDGRRRVVRYSRVSSAKGQPQTIRFVVCLDGPKSFSLKAEGDDPYRITSVGEDMTSVATFDAVFGYSQDASWKFLDGRLADLIRAKDFQLLSIGEVPGPGGSLVKAEFEANSIKTRPTFHRVVCDPANEWAIVESEVRMGSPPSSRVMKIDYGPDRPSPVAHPTRIAIKDFDGEEKSYEFERFEFGPADPKTFQIETYGLKDMSGSLPDQSFRLAWVIGAAGVLAALLITAWALKRAADRR